MVSEIAGGGVFLSGRGAGENGAPYLSCPHSAQVFFGCSAPVSLRGQTVPVEPGFFQHTFGNSVPLYSFLPGCPLLPADTCPAIAPVGLHDVSAGLAVGPGGASASGAVVLFYIRLRRVVISAARPSSPVTQRDYCVPAQLTMSRGINGGWSILLRDASHCFVPLPRGTQDLTSTRSITPTPPKHHHSDSTCVRARLALYSHLLVMHIRRQVKKETWA